MTIMSATAPKMVRKQGPVRWNCLGLSPGTLEFVIAKQAAHLAQFSRPHSATTHAVFCLANKRVKIVVSRHA